MNDFTIYNILETPEYQYILPTGYSKYWTHSELFEYSKTEEL